MIQKRLDLWEKGEYTYPGAYDFIPNIRTYLHEDGTKRPCMLVIPGGGYRMVSPTEAENVALKFYEKGYQTFVCTYTTNMIDTQPLKMQPLKDISRAVRMIRSKAKEFDIRSDQFAVCGFSAGAHLCASLAVHFMDVEEKNTKYREESNRPDGVILSYPVITSGEKAHRDSFTALLGADPSEEELQYMSLEMQVTEQTPPCFLWQTAADEVVPVENSYLFAKSCKEAGVFFEHHVFSRGSHGLSLSDEDWALRRYGEPYTMEQNEKLYQAYLERKIMVPKDRVENLKNTVLDNRKEASVRLGRREAVPEVAVWPELAQAWLAVVLQGK